MLLHFFQRFVNRFRFEIRNFFLYSNIHWKIRNNLWTYCLNAKAIHIFLRFCLWTFTNTLPIQNVVLKRINVIACFNSLNYVCPVIYAMFVRLITSIKLKMLHKEIFFCIHLPHVETYGVGIGFIKIKCIYRKCNDEFVDIEGLCNGANSRIVTVSKGMCLELRFGIRKTLWNFF